MTENTLSNQSLGMKILNVSSTLFIFVLGVLVTVLLSQMDRASEERNDIKQIVIDLGSRVAVMESKQWSIKDQAAQQQYLAERFEALWTRIIALETRPLPEIPPAWFKDMVDALVKKVEENTKALADLKARVEDLSRKEK